MSTGLINTNYSSSGSSKVANLWAGNITLADEGSLYVATNPTPGTAIATTTSVVDDATGATTHAQQKPVMYIQNNWPAGNNNSLNLYLRSLKMFIVQVPTSATAWRYAMRLTPNIGSKLTTAGTVITPAILNANSGTASRAYITFGTVTTTDSTTDLNQRLIANGQVTGAIPVANDEWMFTFGDVANTLDSIGTQTLVKRLTIPTVPVIIPPQWGWTLEMWGASNAAAPSWEFELVYAERPTGQ